MRLALAESSRIYQAEAAVAAVRQRIAELEEEVRPMRSFLSGEVATATRWRLLGLGKTKARIFDVLMRAPIAAHARLAHCLGNGSDPVAIRVHISQMRRVLRPHGVEIETVVDAGYALPPESKRRALVVCAEIEAAPSIAPEACAP